MVASTFEPQLDRFRKDLDALTPTEVLRKHIISGHPVLMSEDQYFDLRTRVANHFQVHQNSVVVVGSCRTGFSIAAHQPYKLATHKSDIDVALVSRPQFEEYWDAVSEYAALDSAWMTTEQSKEFRRQLFHGWIDPRGLPPVKLFKKAKEWTDFFTAIEKTRDFGIRGITARLYRDWSRLEAYQMKSLKNCLTLKAK